LLGGTLCTATTVTVARGSLEDGAFPPNHPARPPDSLRPDHKSGSALDRCAQAVYNQVYNKCVSIHLRANGGGLS